MAKSGVWVNADGLVVGFGTRAVDQGSASLLKSLGLEREIVLKIPDATAIGTAATGGAGIYAPQLHANAATIPAGALVTEVRITADTVATSGGAADFILGTYTIHATTGALVVNATDSLAAAGDSALTDFDAAGETMVLGKGATAALIGKAVTAARLWIAPISPVAYTAGAFTVRVKYQMPAN